MVDCWLFCKQVNRTTDLHFSLHQFWQDPSRSRVSHLCETDANGDLVLSLRLLLGIHRIHRQTDVSYKSFIPTASGENKQQVQSYATKGNKRQRRERKDSMLFYGWLMCCPTEPFSVLPLYRFVTSLISVATVKDRYRKALLLFYAGLTPWVVIQKMLSDVVLWRCCV